MLAGYRVVSETRSQAALLGLSLVPISVGVLQDTASNTRLNAAETTGAQVWFTQKSGLRLAKLLQSSAVSSGTKTLLIPLLCLSYRGHLPEEREPAKPPLTGLPLSG